MTGRKKEVNPDDEFDDSPFEEISEDEGFDEVSEIDDDKALNDFEEEFEDNWPVEEEDE